MNSLDMVSTNHKLEKQNLTSKKNECGWYDEYTCIKCGLRGKRYTLKEDLVIDGRFSAEKVGNCSDAEAPQTIKITHCSAHGKVFENLIPESIHKVVPPPEGQNNKNGVWVMGVGEPVKVLFDEFDEG